MAVKSVSKSYGASDGRDEVSETRSRTMRAVKSKNTSLELKLRAALRAKGASGYRLHRKDLQGKPDIAFIGAKMAVFAHGCFWHRHADCDRGRSFPASNVEYWGPKFARNVQKFEEAQDALSRLGWQVQVVWECQTKTAEGLNAAAERIAAAVAEAKLHRQGF